MRTYYALLTGLCLIMWACPDSTEGDEGEAGTEGGGVAVSGEMAGAEGGETTGATPVGGPCLGDDECPDGTYCEYGDDFNGSCVEGCREGTCEGGRVCDIDDTRECVFPPCGSDAECPEGTYCNEEASVCESGCRVDEACSDAFDEDGRAILCDPNSRECVSHSPCCVPMGDEESCVAATSASRAL